MKPTMKKQRKFCHSCLLGTVHILRNHFKVEGGGGYNKDKFCFGNLSKFVLNLLLKVSINGEGISSLLRFDSLRGEDTFNPAD